MDNAWCAVREGGVVIILGECEEGSGSAQYEKMMQQCGTPEAVEATVAARLPDWRAQGVCGDALDEKGRIHSGIRHGP